MVAGRLPTLLRRPHACVSSGNLAACVVSLCPRQGFAASRVERAKLTRAGNRLSALRRFAKKRRERVDDKAFLGRASGALQKRLQPKKKIAAALAKSRWRGERLRACNHRYSPLTGQGNAATISSSRTEARQPATMLGTLAAKRFPLRAWPWEASSLASSFPTTNQPPDSPSRPFASGHPKATQPCLRPSRCVSRGGTSPR